jgi:DNA (cytosine-5)-methyltransferase 1
MKVLSLFSGVGGFDLGLEAAGMETVFQCEWDKHATSILERHWPHVPRWGDITTLTGKHILAHAPVIDVVAWGSPCQDLSVAGKRAGLEGSRSGLFHEGVRIIKELRKETNNEYPRISIWENVYGALNSNRGADFGVILNEMAEAGSLVQEWRVLDAQYFGVPQRRRRVFLISVFDSATAARCPNPLLPVSEGVQWHPSTSNQTRQTVTGETSASSRSVGFRMRGFGDYESCDTVLMRQREGKPGGGKGPLLSNDKSLTLAGSNDQTLFTPIRGSLCTNYSFDTQFGSNAEVYEDKAPPLKASQQSPSIANSFTMAVRRLTPLECERLMGWPDGWTATKADGTPQSDTHRYKQCGNGIASPVAQWIAQQLLQLTKDTHETPQITT